MLKGTYDSQYYKRDTGNLVFVYVVTGNKAEMAQYEEAQGEHYTENEETGDPLFFTTDYAGPSCDLLITSKGNVIVDTSEMDQIGSLLKQCDDPALKSEVAKLGAAQLMAGITKKKSVVESSMPQATPANLPDDVDGI